MVEAGAQVESDAMRQRAAATAACRARAGSGRESAAADGVERGADALEVAEHRLVYAFGEHEIRERVVHVEQARGLEVDAPACCGS